MKATPSSTGAVAAHRAARPPGEVYRVVRVPPPRPIRSKVTRSDVSAPQVRVVLGVACEACGHRRRTEYVGLPADVVAMLEAAIERAGITKAELARRIGVAGADGRSSYVRKLLTGVARPSQPVAHDIIDALALTWREGEQLLAASGGERDRRGMRAA